MWEFRLPEPLIEQISDLSVTKHAAQYNKVVENINRQFVNLFGFIHISY
jgi:hypothetical protein